MTHLSMIGLLIGDGDGNIDDQLTLSGEAFEKMEDLMSRATILREAISG